MNIFCINLNRAVHRKQKMISDWVDSLGLDVTFWDAFDRQLIDQQQQMIYRYDENLSRRDFGRILSNGEIACATSFYQLFEYIVKNQIEECVVMEDDVWPLIQSQEILDYSTKESKKEFPSMEMLLMHKISPIQAKNRDPKNGATYDDIYSIRKDISSLCRMSPWGNQCFYITKKAVEIILSNLSKHSGEITIWHPADYFALYYLCPLQMVCILNNPICDHHWLGPNATTYIGNEYRNTHRKYIQ